jgi:hypothetical protein
MAETLQEACVPEGALKWHWYNVQRDLVQQGGLKEGEIIIDPFSMLKSPSGCAGQYKEIPFYITWIKDMFLLLSSPKFSPELVNAFSKVVEYKPFARYVESDNNLVTIEWDKVDPEGRYKSLEKEGKKELTRLLNKLP